MTSWILTLSSTLLRPGRFGFAAFTRSLPMLAVLAGLTFTSAWAAPDPRLKLSDAETRWLAAHPVIRIGVDPGYAPYAYVDAQGRFRGVAAEFADKVSALLGIRMELVPLPSWTDIIEAAKLDGVEGLKMFRFITLPSIRSALVVVLTTIGIGTLKVFDIVRTMTGGNFETSVIANEFYDAIFRYNRDGLGAAFAVLLFVLVIPIVVYNIVQMRKDA